jgi:hypothetical protein
MYNELALSTRKALGRKRNGFLVTVKRVERPAFI